MKHIRILMGVCLLAFSFSVNAEDVTYGDYTTPGFTDPDLIIVGGNLDLKDSLTVGGDLKIIGGYVSLASDDASTTTVDLYVYGDLIVTNTDPSGDASIYIPTGKLVVTGEVFTRGDDGAGFVETGYGITAGRLQTYGSGNAYVWTHTGSIEVEEDIVTSSTASSAYVRAGQGESSPPTSYDIMAASISTDGKTATSAYVEADGSIKVSGGIYTRCENGPAYVEAAVFYPGGIEAGSILTTGSGDAYVKAGGGAAVGYVDVSGDIATTSSWGDGYVSTEAGGIKAGNISTLAYEQAYILVEDSLEVRGDVITKSINDIAVVFSLNKGIKAKSISTNGYGSSSVESLTEITVAREITTKSSNNSADVSCLSGPIIAGRISTDGYVSSVVRSDSYISVDGTINTKCQLGEGTVEAQGDIIAGSIFTYSASAYDYVLSSLGSIVVKDDIRTKVGNWDGYVKANNNITARSISTEGDGAYIEATNGSINVVEDINTLALGSDGYVKALNGSISAQKIKTEAPTGQDDSIQAAAGSAEFKFIPTENDVAKIIKDAEFSFNADSEWNTQLTLQGTCTINGNGHTLTFSDNGGIIVGSSAVLLLRNIMLNNIGGEAVACADNTATMSLDDVTWSLTADFAFKNGTFYVIDDFHITGSGTRFSYESPMVSTITSTATLRFDRGVTLNYNTNHTRRLAMLDPSSRLNFDGATLEATQDIRFTEGTLVFDNYVTFNAPASRTIYFGDGVSAANNINYDHHVASQFNVTGEGSFVNANM